jgi:DNA polymerase-3 subunit delta'
MDWLRAQGLAEPATLLAACSGRPLDARDLAAAGLDAARWQALPAAVLQRQPGALGSLPLPTLIDVLQKICHDGLILAAGASPRFFPEAALAAPAASEALALWSRELARIARHADHPWHEGLLVDSLLARTASAWQGRFDP